MAVHSHADHPHPHHLAEQIPPIQFESTGLDDNGSETVGRRDSAAGAGLARSSSGEEYAETAAEKGEPGSPRLGRHDVEKAASLPHAAPPADDFPDGGWRAWR